jgi:hypothetical protein
MWKSLILRAGKEDEPFGRKPGQTATNKDIEQTINQAKKKLNVDLPESYVNFLQFRDGFGFEGLLVYGAVSSKKKEDFHRDVIEVNEKWRERKEHKNYMFFADSDMYLYGLNLLSKQYEQQDRYSSDVLQLYPDFDEMLADAIKSEL